MRFRGGDGARVGPFRLAGHAEQTDRSLDAFRAASTRLAEAGIALRAFVLLAPPFVPRDEAVEWACRSIEEAFDCGATVCSVIATRAGNGALDALECRGCSAPPSLEMLEDTLERGLRLERGVVLADTWRSRLVAWLSVRRGASPSHRGDESRAGRRSARRVRPLRNHAMSDFDVVVVGAGFGGSLLAAISKRIGYRVALVERGRHPRFAIGESTSPLANIILEQLSARYELPGVAPLASYGSWLAAYPDVQRGLKRGFTFYAQTSGASFTPRVDRSNELLVTASPNDVVSDTHWLRSDVDAFLVEEAVRAGVEYVDETDLDRIDIPGGGRAASLAGSRKGRAFRITGGFVVDATGPNGSVSRALGIGRTAFDSFRATHTVFSHFSGVARCADMPEYGHGGLRPRIRWIRPRFTTCSTVGGCGSFVSTTA